MCLTESGRIECKRIVRKLQQIDGVILARFYSRIGLQANRQCLWQTICGGILRIWYVLSNVRCGVLGLSTTKRGRKLRLSVHGRRGILKVSICNRRRQLRDVLRLGSLSVR